jgi:hypothetical protein
VLEIMLPAKAHNALGSDHGLTRRSISRGILGLAASTVPLISLAGPALRILKYHVVHSTYGSIGDYSNNIVSQNEETVVRTQLRLLVTLFGFVLHREDAHRTERWSGERLVAFHGTTTVNGEDSTVVGEAGSQGFVITSALGVVVAPENIRPSNPWSAGFLSADTMMLSDSGKVEHVRISRPKKVTVMIGNADIQAREYEISADPSYKVWLDASDVPVMFLVNDDSGTVIFTLVQQT